MIDVHCHSLCGVDDGAIDQTISLEMFEEAIADGVTKVMCTPHCIPKGRFENTYQQIKPIFDSLQQTVTEKGLNISLYLGAEVAYNEDFFNAIEEDRVVFLNGTKRMLLEFPWKEVEYPFDPVEIAQTVISKGYQLIIAHPERYQFVHQDITVLEELKKLGCNFQVNRTSLVFDTDRNHEVAWKIVEAGYVDVVASDAHRPNSVRNIILSDAYKMIEERYGKQEAERLFIENPQRVLDGRELIARK